MSFVFFFSWNPSVKPISVQWTAAVGLFVSKFPEKDKKGLEKKKIYTVTRDLRWTPHIGIDTGFDQISNLVTICSLVMVLVQNIMMSQWCSFTFWV